MQNEDLLYIEDDKKRKLFYSFTPAAFVSNFIPLIVILDEEERAKATNFEYKMWNVLTPLGHSGHEDTNSYWLWGEVEDLLQTLIQQIAEEYECEDHIYLYGNGMDGYGAILHGILCQANAVYVQAPHIRLQNTDSTIPSKENDLTHFLNSTDSFPIFYVCNDKVDDDTTYFVNVCKKHGINVDLDFCPKSEDNGTKVLKEVLDFFEKVASER